MVGEFELTEQELQLVPVLIKGFSTHDVSNPIKAPEIVRLMNKYLKDNNSKVFLTDRKLRLYCNYIRINSLLPLISNHKGYYVSNDREEIKKKINTLTETAKSLNESIEGLKKFL